MSDIILQISKIYAGKSSVVEADTAARDIQSEIFFPAPETPKAIKKYRKNLNVGEITRDDRNLSDKKCFCIFTLLEKPQAIQKNNKG
jgi:hypothetical protein